MNADTHINNRAAGVLVVSACGDALGAGYEFQPPEAIREPVGMIGGGAFRWEPGEWTDDTSMSWVIAEVAAAGNDLRDDREQDAIAAGWYSWLREAKDVGNQTRAALLDAAAASDSAVPTAATLRAAARDYHRRSGTSGGNGSLMRTAPVALSFLEDADALTEAAIAISVLTHYDPEAGQACVLSCQAIRHAVLTGDLDLRVGLDSLPPAPRDVWAARIEEAESRPPQSFRRNGWVVEALMGAWSAVVTGSGSVRDGLEAAVRGGHDTDTVAAIAGALLGAASGLDAVPRDWLEILHGWPGKRATDLEDLARRIVGGDSVEVSPSDGSA